MFKKITKGKEEQTSPSSSGSNVLSPIISESQKSTSLQQKLLNKIHIFVVNPYNIAFFGILLLAILFRLKYFSMDSIWNDAAVHLWYAIQAVREPVATLFSLDYYLGDYAIPQTITAFYYLVFTNDIFIAGKLMALTYSVLGIVFIYLLGAELKDKLTGVLAALLFSFNHIFFFYSVRPLGDAPLTVSVILLLYFIVRLEKEKRLIWGLLTAVALIGTMLHKVQASIFVLGYVIYCILFKRQEMFKNKAVFYSWSIPVAGVLIAHFIAFTFSNANLLGRLFGLMTQFRGMPFGLEAAGMIKWVLTWYLIPFVILGILFVIIYKEKKYYSLLALGIFYWLYFEINVDHTQDRYMLPLLPFAIFFAVFAITEIGSYLSIINQKLLGRKIIQALIGVIIILAISWQYYGTAEALVAGKQYSFSGFPEAGEWLKQNVPNDAIIFSGAPRTMRAFAEKEWYKGPAEDSPVYGGNLYWLRGERYHHNFRDYDYDEVINPNAQKNFEDDVSVLTKDHVIYIEINIWEYAQPRWYFPITQDSLNYFRSLGFQIVKVVERDIPTSNGLQRVPVIFILKKDKES